VRVREPERKPLSHAEDATLNILVGIRNPMENNDAPVLRE
jgi:hypothetical protein